MSRDRFPQLFALSRMPGAACYDRICILFFVGTIRAAQASPAHLLNQNEPESRLFLTLTGLV
jgi:hypothetical protein